MRETWINWILNRTTPEQRICVYVAVAGVVAFAIFMCLP
jgi:hypothetical protein